MWGGYFGLILGLEASAWEKTLKRAPRILQHVYALLIVIIGWVFFRISNLQNWGPFFGALFGVNGFTHLETLRSLNILFYWPMLVAAILLCLPFWSNIKTKFPMNSMFGKVLYDLVVYGVFLLAVSYILTNGFKVFMYARF
jgi:alginate O-acetyltransferase complex protein AlgI